MIYTITANPALDVTNRCEEPVKPGTTRPKEQWRHAGGKGIDASRVVRNLGGTSVAMGFLGGYTGRFVEGLLRSEGLKLDFINVNQETRTNVIIVAPQEETGEIVDYRFNSPGPEVQPVEYLELYKKIEKLRQTDKEKMPTHVAVCGSLCKGMQATFYVAIVRDFKEMGAFVALDTSGTALKESLKYEPRPDLIKPNIVEFNELIDYALLEDDDRQDPMYSDLGEGEFLRAKCKEECGGSGGSPSEFWERLMKQVSECLEKYADMRAIALSLGESGILLALRGKCLHGKLTEPVTHVECAVGAGDAALAALLFERDRGGKWEKALRMAVAAGAAAVTKKGTESPSEEEVVSFRDKVEIHEHEL